MLLMAFRCDKACHDEMLISIGDFILFCCKTWITFYFMLGEFYCIKGFLNCLPRIA
jgi:hypothetical protein